MKNEMSRVSERGTPAHVAHADTFTHPISGQAIKSRDPSAAPITADLWDSATTAAYIGKAQITLAQWRMTGRGPRFMKIGGSVRYRKADVIAWLETCVVEAE